MLIAPDAFWIPNLTSIPSLFFCLVLSMSLVLSHSATRCPFLNAIDLAPPILLKLLFACHKPSRGEGSSPGIILAFLRVQNFTFLRDSPPLGFPVPRHAPRNSEPRKRSFTTSEVRFSLARFGYRGISHRGLVVFWEVFLFLSASALPSPPGRPGHSFSCLPFSVFFGELLMACGCAQRPS